MLSTHKNKVFHSFPLHLFLPQHPQTTTTKIPGRKNQGLEEKDGRCFHSFPFHYTIILSLKLGEPSSTLFHPIPLSQTQENHSHLVCATFFTIINEQLTLKFPGFALKPLLKRFLFWVINALCAQIIIYSFQKISNLSISS